MENFFLDGEFYDGLEDVIEQYEWSNYSEIPDDFNEVCYESVERPIGKFDLEDLSVYIDECCEENIPENHEDWYYEKIKTAVEQSIDFKKLNELLPTSYVKSNVKFILTKEDFEQFFNDQF